MGIGLAICQSIIAAHAAHGCALVAANRDEGGARFSFRLLAKPTLRSSCFQLRNSFEM